MQNLTFQFGKKEHVQQFLITEWYSGKNIFVTGATGFIGKVLIEKLLRSCPEIKTLYLLIRKKNGIGYITRKEQYFKCLIFKHILEKNPNVINKVHVVKGDVLKPNLGLDTQDIDVLISKVEIIFHCAANVRFDQPLRPMIQMNVVGTLKILKLAKKMLNLSVLVHVSTTYCQCNETVLEEHAYPAPQNPFDIIQILNVMEDDVLAAITPKLLNGLPNTYAYSKALSEDLICRYGQQLPIIITRPSIVTAAIKDPIPGWIEGINGPTGLMIGAARGVIRSMHCNPDYTATIIPVDTAINGMIIAAYDRAHINSKEIKFCNLCIPSKALLTWGDSIEIGKRFFYETPPSFALWYPDGSIKKNYFSHLLCVFFFHYLPAYFIDLCLILLHRKPFLVHVQNKISTGLNLLQYYTTKNWDFKNENFQQMYNNLGFIDQQEFDISVSQINWEQYIRCYIKGMRTYILGESDTTLPRAKNFLCLLYTIDKIAKFTLGMVIFFFLWIRVDHWVEYSKNLIQSSLEAIYSEPNVTCKHIYLL